MRTPCLWIVDTNVVVAALLTADTASPTARVLDHMLVGRQPFLLSPDLLAEYRAVLLRTTLLRLHGLSPAELEVLLTSLASAAAWREPATPLPHLPALPDPGDSHLWQLLHEEPESLLITGDKRLVAVEGFARRILTPREACVPPEGSSVR